MPLPDVEVDQPEVGAGGAKGVEPARRIEEVGLRLVGEGIGLALGQEAVDVEAARADRELVAGQPDLEAGLVARRAAATDDVLRLELRPSTLDGLLLVPVGVELDASLLHEDARVVPPRIECLSAEITLHRGVPQLSWMTPASRPKRRYSSSRTLRLVSRWGAYTWCSAPISDSSSAPVRISAGQRRLSWP